MEKNAVILIAEDDTGHFELVKKNLWLSCVDHEILQFRDGQQILDFLFETGKGAIREAGQSYILILDIRMPKVDGREVLRRMKEDNELRKIPVFMLTTTDDISEVERCYKMGCSFYMVKPIDYHKFMMAMRNLGTFLSMEWVKVLPIK
ncbi:MAG: response regulator [Planctomycetota bacterium]|jgi:CheY-like chemotaxis protein